VSLDIDWRSTNRGQADDPPDDDPWPEDEPTGPETPDEYAAAHWRDVHHELERLKVRHEAGRLFRESQAQPPTTKPRTLAESLADPEHDEPHRIHGLTRKGARTTFVARRKTGKTTMTANVIRSLLTGEPFLGRFPVEPVGRVFVLNYEMSESQWADWMRDHGLAEYGDRITAWHLRGQPNPLATEEGRRALAEHLTAHEVLLVDTFSRAFTGDKDSDNRQVASFLSDVLDQAAGPGRDVFLTVHAGWTAERSRGASALEDWPDCILTLAEEDDVRYLSALGRDVEFEGEPLSYDADTRALSFDPLKPRRSHAAQAKKDQERLRKSREKDAADLARRQRNLRALVEMLADWPKHNPTNPVPGVRDVRNGLRESADWSGSNVEIDQCLEHAAGWHLIRREDVQGGRGKVGHHVTQAGLDYLERPESQPTYGEGDQQ
jgi:hypothetical protein